MCGVSCAWCMVFWCVTCCVAHVECGVWRVLWRVWCVMYGVRSGVSGIPTPRTHYTHYCTHMALTIPRRQVALKLVPSKREFLQRLGPLVAEEVTEAELRDHAEVVKQITDTLRTLFRELDLEDTRKV